MGNDKLTEKIFLLVSVLPYFTMADLAYLNSAKTYLKIILSRYAAKEKIIRLKKGMYVSKEYIEKTEKNNTFSDYTEFISNVLYQPSYLSMDYVLYENNILSEAPRNFVSVSLVKTENFTNKFGNFFYHKIKKGLFDGFIISKKGDFAILKATKAKALFDFLYFRKNNIINKNSFEELRLNLENMNDKDWREFEKYLKIENSKKMKDIFNMIKANAER